MTTPIGNSLLPSVYLASPRDTSGDDVEISPRYLAGGTPCGSDVFSTLRRDQWHAFHDEQGNYYATSHGNYARIALLPEPSEIMPDATALWHPLLTERNYWMLAVIITDCDCLQSNDLVYLYGRSVAEDLDITGIRNH